MEFILNLQQNMMLVSNIDNIINMGDLNDRCTQWDSLHTNSVLKQDLLDSTTALGLYQLINEPTYHTGNSDNILDLIFTNNPGNIINAGTIPQKTCCNIL